MLFLSLSRIKNTIWFDIPKQIYEMIWDYAKPKQAFYIKDLGSKFGTYTKLDLVSRIQ